ncbi:hypothetical protein KEJ31_04620 [Candidatus Bathyarchaeota archaeon]|nr:hypothetical protein [Candidatus Bathyarchaeota archaeon]
MGMEDLIFVIILFIVIIAMVTIALIFHTAFEWIDSLLGISISGQVSPIVPTIIIVAIIAITVMLLKSEKKGDGR